MPQQIIEYRLFIASPGDVQAERDIIRAVVNEYNLVNNINSVKIVCIGWENDIYPSVGDDPQDAVNIQVADRYDIFVGIFWGRFGTPTKRESSGTKEEFEIAYSKFQMDKNSVSILMYFKTESIEFENIDPLQIANIKEFKMELTQRGVLYKQFRETKEFEQMFRLNLASLMQDLRTKVKVETLTDTALIISPTMEEDEELGIYEHIDNSTQSFISSARIVNRLVDYINDIGTQINHRTDKLNSSNNLPFNEKQAYVRRNIDLVADDLNTFASRVKLEIPALNNEFAKALESCSKAIEISKEYDLDQNGDIKEFVETLIDLASGISTGKKSIEQFNSAIFKVPSLTSKLIKAKKESARVLSNLIAEMESELNLIDEIREIARIE